MKISTRRFINLKTQRVTSRMPKVDVGASWNSKPLSEILQDSYPDELLKYTHAFITSGWLAKPHSFIIKGAEPNNLLLSWPKNPEPRTHPWDRLMVVVHCNALQLLWTDLDTQYFRMEGTAIISIPRKFAPYELQVWVAWRRLSEGLRSDSKFIGSICLPNSTSHEKV